MSDERHAEIFGLVTAAVFLPGVPLLWGTVGAMPLWVAIPLGIGLGFCFWMLASLDYGLAYFKERGRPK